MGQGFVLGPSLNENKYGQIFIGSATICPLTQSQNGALIKLLDSTKDFKVAFHSRFKQSIRRALLSSSYGNHLLP